MTGLHRFNTLDLDALNAHGALLRRFDTKYIVQQDLLSEIYTSLPENFLVLLNEERLSTPYTTCYYDTSLLDTYFDHLKKRRKRFKIRTRFYNTPHDGYLEIKIKKPREQTEKIRWSYDVAGIGDTLTPEHIAHLNEALASAAYPPLKQTYQRTVTTEFVRTTLYSPVSKERITVDTELVVADIQRSLAIGTHHAIIEIKSPTQVGHTHRILTQLGIRPVSISKYCLAMTALHPELRGAPWRAPLRQLGVSETPPQSVA